MTLSPFLGRKCHLSLLRSLLFLRVSLGVPYQVEGVSYHRELMNFVKCSFFFLSKEITM